MFVVTLPASASDPQVFANQAKGMGADLVEIRGDITPEVPDFKSPLPLIVTPRGQYELLFHIKPEFIDLDINEELDYPEGSKIIRSFHDFDKTPPLEDLIKTFNEMSQRADIIKIAVKINSFGDIQILNDLYDKFPRTLLSFVKDGKHMQVYKERYKVLWCFFCYTS